MPGTGGARGAVTAGSAVLAGQRRVEFALAQQHGTALWYVGVQLHRVSACASVSPARRSISASVGQNRSRTLTNCPLAYAGS